MEICVQENRNKMSASSIIEELRRKFPYSYDIRSEKCVMRLISTELTRIDNIQQHGSGGTSVASRRKIHLKYVDDLSSIIRDDSYNYIKLRIAYQAVIERLKLYENSFPEDPRSQKQLESICYR